MHLHMVWVLCCPHLMGEGEHPIAFASRSLAPEEKNYSQIDKALAIVFGVKHFHQYFLDGVSP